MMSLLTYIVALPLLAAVGLVFVPRHYRVIMRAAALAATFVTMLLAIVLFVRFNGADADEGGFKFVATITGLGAQALGMAC